MLSLIAEGKKHLVIDMVKISELTDGETAEEVAREVYEAESISQGIYKPYVNVCEPEVVDSTWVVHKHLTPAGQAVYEALRTGVFWDTANNCMDFGASIAYYQEMINKGSVDMRFVELIALNQNEEFKDLKGKLVYFKMQGQKKDNKITNL